jgi:predicted oxidoreductase
MRDMRDRNNEKVQGEGGGCARCDLTWTKGSGVRCLFSDEMRGGARGKRIQIHSRLKVHLRERSKGEREEKRAVCSARG